MKTVFVNCLQTLEHTTVYAHRLSRDNQCNGEQPTQINQYKAVECQVMSANIQLSLIMRKPNWFLNRSDTNRAVEPKKMARSLKFQI